MRQQHPPAGTVFLLCTKCDRGEWRRVGDTATDPTLPDCKHCGGITVQRFPLTLALTAADRGLLKAIADWQRIKTDAAATNAIHREFRAAAKARAGKKPIPQWAADWLQNNPEK
jgi:hypothetical protein